jgi:hypothetical protein
MMQRTRAWLLLLLALVAVLLGGAYFGAQRASHIATGLLRSWGTGAVSEASDSVYQLTLGAVDFSWSLRRVTVDSMRLTTNGGRNAQRHQPLANLQLLVTGCRISGIQVVRLVRGRGLEATSFGCDSGAVTVVVPRRTPDSAGGAAPVAAAQDSAHPAPRGFLVLQRSLTLPASAPHIRIARVSFPHLGFDFRLQHARTGDATLQLERLQWHMTGLEIDPSDPAAALRPLFSRTIRATAENFVAYPDSVTMISVRSLTASLTDSTVEVLGAGIAPRLDDAAYARASRYSRTRVEAQLARVAATGLDFGALATGGSVHARRVEVDSFALDAYKDKRRPANPVQRRRRTPQQWIADLNGSLDVDSLLIRDARVTYRERRVDREQPGVLTFAAIQGIGTNIRHVPGRRTTDDPMTLGIKARLQDAGALDVRFVVPLDAPRFDMTYRGTLGAMPAEAINALTEELFAMRISKGQVHRVDFAATVRGGVTRGEITPQFSDFSVAITEAGSSGVLGGGGLLGRVSRGVASMAANLLKVRSNNPERSNAAPLVGVVSHTYQSHETLPSFLWAGLRDGLLAVVKR